MREMRWTRAQLEEHSETELACIDAVLEYEAIDRRNKALRAKHESHRMRRYT